MAISFVWWNTSLSPAVNTTIATPDQAKKAAMLELLSEFMTAGITFICLCEISSEDVSCIEAALKPPYKIIDGTRKTSSTRFDTCVLYDEETVLFVSNLDHTLKEAGRTHKTAQSYDFLDNRQIPIRLYLSHWPSKLQDNAMARRKCASDLRMLIKDSFSGNCKHIVLIGDYNCEPSSEEIDEIVLASRERNLLGKKNRSDLMYNPCWKFMTQAQHSPNQDFRIQGSYSYSQAGASKEWFTFDQIIFSSAFTNPVKGWSLLEDTVAIIDFKDHVVFKTLGFDHYPITAHAESFDTLEIS